MISDVFIHNVSSHPGLYYPYLFTSFMYHSFVYFQYVGMEASQRNALSLLFWDPLENSSQWNGNLFHSSSLRLNLI